MAIRSKRILDWSIVGLLAGLLVMPSARSFTLTGGRLVEDFSTDAHADYASSTGVWDTVNSRARAAVVAGAVATQALSFGDGSDGDLDTAGAVALDTNSHPNGYNYRSLHLRTGATVSVTGSSALVIRSLTTIQIDAGVTFSVKGTAGASGTNSVAAATTTLADTTPGSAQTCGASGGLGGGTTAVVGNSGANGKQSNGTTDEPGTAGLGNSNLAGGDGADAVFENDPGFTPRPVAANFFTTGFVCGSGGGGGGADIDNPGPITASGGAGGGGGGRVRLISLGDLTVSSAIDASGGDGGTGGETGTACAGNGGPGNGGAVWLQSAGLLNITAAALPVVDPGLDFPNVCHPLGVGGDFGDSRADYAGNDPDFPATAATSNAAANQSYDVVSNAYDLNTLNAVFSNASVTSSAPGGGSASVSYAGSITGASYSAFTTDITQLSNKNFRYLKFKVTINTAGVAAASPQVSQIAIDFKDAGLPKADLKLSPGCGTLVGVNDGDAGPGTGGFTLALGWLAFWLIAYRVFRYGRFGRYGFVLKDRRL